VPLSLTLSLTLSPLRGARGSEAKGLQQCQDAPERRGQVNRSLPCLSLGHNVKFVIVLTQQAILDALKTVKYPGYSRDVVSFGLVKEVAVKGGAASVSLQLTGGGAEIAKQIKSDIEQALRSVPGVERMHVEVLAPAGQTAPVQAGSPFGKQAKLPGLGCVVAIASGKGGVGKSTVSVNLACALRHLGAAVGLLDCDIYGPSIPLMMGIHDRPTSARRRNSCRRPATESNS
jgi:metal-sulfur cluster biosynthetic enzyme